ncbi:hypothetical protein PORY_002756 [Pneumocystis oryctolagi]|uniref:Uncharacterized protein n=1 Tax=Pneumocystis oryctolagi TaxID=42067 RepID=A0ACB7C859_9ASCO|nr:hypothetical protein PORY_002756 [Pneumocystis oryctolagi]
MSELRADGRADCLFFMNNSCSKGDLCIYRHNISARESRVQCIEFQERQTCSKVGCNDRHLTSYISGTYCYWETTMTGCTKAICPFKHHGQPGAGKQVLFNHSSGKVVESAGNSLPGVGFDQKNVSCELSLKTKQKEETPSLLGKQNAHVNESLKTHSLSGNSTEQCKRKSESVLLPSSGSKKQEKMSSKDKNTKAASQIAQNKECLMSAPTAPKSQRNTLQIKTSTKGSKASHTKKQDKRNLTNVHEKDNVEFRVRTLDEIREEKAAKLRQIEKNKIMDENQKENISSKGLSDVAQTNDCSEDQSKADVDKKKSTVENVKSDSLVCSSQENVKQLKNSLTSDFKNDINPAFLPLSDDDLDSLNENESKVMDINIQNENNDFEDDELAAFERELES